MSYAMGKTPRSSFMYGRPGMGGEVTASIETPPIMSPPFNPSSPVVIPSGVMPTPAASSGLGKYVIWGGLAYLAYLLWSKE